MTRAIVVSLASLAAAGCIRLTPVQEGLQADAPAILHPAAREFVGVPRDRIYAEASQTSAQLAFDTQLIRRIAERSREAVVSIYVKTSSPYRLSLLPIQIPGTSFRVRLRGRGLGSGFFVHPSGLLLTNNHVIRDAHEIRVLTRTQDGGEQEDLAVTVIARDPAFDLALLRVEDPEREFPVLPMGDSSDVDVGEPVIAVGNPLGLGHSVTFGIISQTGRNLSGISDEEGRHIEFLQTDTAINPGSSGGPLITLTGAWVGVNTAGVTQAQGIGFAVPSSQVVEFLDEVREGKGEQW